MYKEQVKRVLLASICLTSLFGSISACMLLPIFPALFLNRAYGLILEGSINRDLMYSLSVAFFPLAMLVGTPIFGAASDIFRQHKSRLIFYGIVCIMLSDIMSLSAILLHNVWLFLLSRLICGFCVAEFSVLMSLLNDLSENYRERKNNLKLLTASMAAGSVCGPLITLYLLTYNYKSLYLNTFSLTFFAATVFDLFSVAIFFYCAQVSSPLQSKGLSSPKITLTGLINSISFMLRHPTAKILVYVYILYSFGTGLLIQGVPIYLAKNFNYDSSKIGFYTTTMAIATIVGMYIIEPIIASLIKDFRKTLKICLLGFTILFILVYILGIQTMFVHKRLDIDRIYLIWVISLFISFMMSLSRVSFYESFALSVEPDKQSSAVSTMSQWFNIAGILSGTIIGFLIAHKALIFLAGITLGISYLLLIHYIKLTQKVV